MPNMVTSKYRNCNFPINENEYKGLSKSVALYVKPNCCRPLEADNRQRRPVNGENDEGGADFQLRDSNQWLQRMRVAITNSHRA